jgi:hypothetical protein
MTFVVTDRLVALHETDPGLTCNAGWCSPDSDGTPVPYSHTCGGTVHADHLDQSNEPPHWNLQLACDGCDFRQTFVQTKTDVFTPKVAPESLQAPAAVPPPAKAAKKTPAKRAAKKKA